MTRMAPPHRGHTGGSTSDTFRIRRAQERRTASGARSVASDGASVATTARVVRRSTPPVATGVPTVLTATGWFSPGSRPTLPAAPG
jgi:hypothetical protein